MFVAEKVLLLLVISLTPNTVELSTKSLLYINGLAQDCSNSIANALELLQSYATPSIAYNWLSNKLIIIVILSILLEMIRLVGENDIYVKSSLVGYNGCYASASEKSLPIRENVTCLTSFLIG